MAKPCIEQPRFAQGFTLIEVLVASAILALMALMSWRGLDSMSLAQQQLQTDRMHTKLCKWGWRSGAPIWTAWSACATRQHWTGMAAFCASHGNTRKTRKLACKWWLGPCAAMALGGAGRVGNPNP
ncbi:MAG: prepilin-type N-terminal cleavage/methylation domain-containing protein [Betaproteobacteria bacterium]|nr:prepilin-type N-terminal cleavage/methylation domain-containing protein [Betaproteobacteria bacterium]